MNNMAFDLQKRLLPILRRGEIAVCQTTVAESLRNLPRSPFHIALELSISTEAEALGGWFDEFVTQQNKALNIRAIYAEMNAFCINPDLWFFNAFAYGKYGGNENYDWLSQWNGQSEPVVIEGFEPLQKVYASGAFRDRRFSEACAITDLLIVIKFQDWIRRAIPYTKEVQCPVLATAHDYDFIYEIKPAQ